MLAVAPLGSMKKKLAVNQSHDRNEVAKNMGFGLTSILVKAWLMHQNNYSILLASHHLQVSGETTLYCCHVFNDIPMFAYLV